MYEPYDDDEYDDDYYDYDKNQWYYKFDVSQNPIFSKWVNDIVNNIINPLDDSILSQLDKLFGIDTKKTHAFPVNSWNPNTVNNKFQYLGSNYAGESIWKSIYFVCDKTNIEYKNHLQANAAHFIQQPRHYKGLFDILN